MPNHLHMLITPGEQTSLERAVMMIKGGSSHRIKKELLYSSPIWMSGYHDRWIRNSAEYQTRKRYIEQNPVKAGLVETVTDYPLGSASGKHEINMCKFDERELQGLKPLGRTKVLMSPLKGRPTNP